jgi:hypothetical protein
MCHRRADWYCYSETWCPTSSSETIRPVTWARWQCDAAYRVGWAHFLTCSFVSDLVTTVLFGNLNTNDAPDDPATPSFTSSIISSGEIPLWQSVNITLLCAPCEPTLLQDWCLQESINDVMFNTFHAMKELNSVELENGFPHWCMYYQSK